MMLRLTLFPLVVIAFSVAIRSTAAAESPAEALAAEKSDPAASRKVALPDELSWLDDYGVASDRAERQGKMLLIYFYDAKSDPLCDRFESDALADEKVIRHMEAYVRIGLPLDAKIISGGKELVLLEHGSFSEMLRGPGVAIVDYLHKESDYSGCVVSQFPFIKGRPYDAKEMQVILTLPEGSLTQRTLVFAVRTHPERPASTDSDLSPYLANEAERHSRHQARIRLQGHHQWDSRAQRINGRLGSGLLASEVCAESWPGEGLVEAAIECVRCWRFSSGHWSAVRAENGAWGYDMKRGSNGIWYATGIFGRRR
jgi:hypothetical protein